MKAWRRLFLPLLVIAVSFAVNASLAEQKTFTIDQSKSGLVISGTFTYIIPFPFTAQGANSLTTSYTGTLEVDITGSTITFVGGSLIAGANNGTWQPGVGGTPGVSAPANYGGKVDSGGPAYASVRDTLLDATSPATTITGITFPATNLSFFFPAVSATYIDYSHGLNGGGSGRQQLLGTYQNAINTNATLVTQGSQLVLNIPVDITGTTTALSANDITYRLRGRLVATAAATTTPLKITSFQVAANQATIKIDTTPTQHFTVLGTTNFINWSTNDAFTASVTNTTRVFSLPSPVRQFFRVRQD